MTDALADVARLLKAMRLLRDWSPEELAEKAGVSPGTVREYESDASLLSPQTADQILKAMPLRPEDDALWGTPAPSSEPPPEVLAQMEARMLELEAALRIDKARFRDALDLLERALSLEGRPERIGRLLLSKAAVLIELSREEKALAALQDAERRLDLKAEPDLCLRLRLDQLYLLCHAGRYGEAEAWRAETLELAARAGNDSQRRQARHLAGRIAGGLKRTAEAVEILQTLRAELTSLGRSFEVAETGLDLAGPLADHGDLPQLAELAQELEALTGKSSLPPAGRSALKVFCRAVGRGSFQAEMGPRLATEFRKTRTRLTRPYIIP